MRKVIIGLATYAILAASGPAAAQSTITYIYDALGRLTGSRISGGPTNGTATDIGLDAAGNRTSYRVGGVSGNGNGSEGNDDGAAVPKSAPRIIVVPLNGFKIIPIG